MFCALLGHTGERLQDHWSSGFNNFQHFSIRLCYGCVLALPCRSNANGYLQCMFYGELTVIKANRLSLSDPL